jgi:hypothetical protein
VGVPLCSSAVPDKQVTRALTSKKTFEALTGMAEKIQRRTDPRTVKIEFSEAVLLAVSIVPSGRLDHADESGQGTA